MDPTSGTLRVLIVEDSRDDVELLLRELRRGGYEVAYEQVQTEDAMRSALVEREWDLVLSDYAMPRFSAPAALAVLKDVGRDIPFMIVSGTIGEETAVDALKAGAHDFMVKGRLARLLPAIERELREVHARRRQRAAEDALRASEERFRAVTDTAPDAVVSAAEDGAIVYANKAAERMFGLAAPALVGQPLTCLFPERFQDTYRAELSRAAGETRTDPHPNELCGQRADGSEFPIEIAMASWRLAERTFVTAIIRDIGDRKAMEAQLRVADRMASVGTLAAGIAHEINNPLAAIMANLELASRGAAELEPRVGGLGDLVELLSDARDAADRVRVIVRDLRIFSRADDDEQRPVSVERVLDSTVRMAWNEIRHRARLVKQYGDVPLVHANESRLGQVFLNLVVNAAHAIPEGATETNDITLTTSTDASGRVIVDVADTGCGMSPKVLARLFTPFFTTKPPGVGTGLGLSICQRILASIGGSISVDSTVNAGTTVRVVLPPATTAATSDAQPALAPVAATRRGRILVIDDEPLVATPARRTLTPAHDIVALTSAAEGLARIKGGERFDVILSDLMMPGMSGMELHAALVREARDQAERLVFLTGGAFTPQARAFLDRVSNPRIEKPFDAMYLRAFIDDKIR